MTMITITPRITGCSEQVGCSTLVIMAAYDNWENKQNYALNLFLISSNFPFGIALISCFVYAVCGWW